MGIENDDHVGASSDSGKPFLWKICWVNPMIKLEICNIACKKCFKGRNLKLFFVDLFLKIPAWELKNSFAFVLVYLLSFNSQSEVIPKSWRKK